MHETIDLRELGLSKEQWRELRLAARAAGVPIAVFVASVIIPDYMRRRRRQAKG